MAKGKRKDVEETIVQETPKKVFKFESKDRKYLYVGTLGVQFRDGKFETDNEKLAEALRAVQAVQEVK